MKTYEEAEKYAKSLYEDTNIMLDEDTGNYHVVRLFGVEHWKQHFKNIAEVRVNMVVTKV